MPRAHIDGHLALDPKANPPFEDRYDINILIEVGATAPRDATPNPDGSVPVVRLLEDILAQMFEAGLVWMRLCAQRHTKGRDVGTPRGCSANCLLRNIRLSTPISPWPCLMLRCFWTA